MALDYTILGKPANPQIIDLATGRMREEWILFLQRLVTRLNAAVGELAIDYVQGPASSTNNNLVAFDGTTGKLIKDAGISISDVLTEAEAAAAYQPLDSDLTSIAALTTTAYGRALLTIANATALAAEVDSFFLTPTEGNAAYQPLDSDLTAIAALSTDTFGRSLLTQASAAAALATLGAMGQGKHTIFVPAAAMKKRTTGPSTGAFSAGATEFDYWAFDPGTNEDVTFNVAMPKSWNEGSVSYQVYWTHPATVTNFGVVWAGFVKAYSNDDAMDGASYTTIGAVADTGGTTSDLYIADESASTAVGSAAENDLLNFIIRRNATDGNDSLTVDAYLIGVKIFYTTNAATDA